MIEECEAPLYAVPYFINGRVYIICLTPSFQIKGDEMYPAIDRKELQEKVLMPLMQSFKQHICSACQRYSPFRFANITLCIDICQKVNEKAANDCSPAAVQ